MKIMFPRKMPGISIITWKIFCGSLRTAMRTAIKTGPEIKKPDRTLWDKCEKTYGAQTKARGQNQSQGRGQSKGHSQNQTGRSQSKNGGQEGRNEIRRRAAKENMSTFRRKATVRDRLRDAKRKAVQHKAVQHKAVRR